MAFVHLHTHTCYSLLDGASKIKKLVAQAQALGMEALAITDHGAMYGVIEFYKEAKKVGLKPIIGCEVYVAPRSYRDKVAGQDDSPYHLVLLAETQEGYQNLLKLVSAAWLDGFYYKPRVDKMLLRKYSQGLIALSACLAGEIPTLLLQGKKEAAEAEALVYQEIFGKGNFYLELMDHGLPEQRQANAHLLALSEATGIPVVASNDVHYLEQSDAAIQDVMLCIQTGKTLQDQNRMRFETHEFYLKSPQEMQLLFGDYPQALSNTVDIARRCQVEFTFGQNHLPFYQVPEGFTVDSYLRELCVTGLGQRYPQITAEHEERLTYELDTIRNMGFSGYFLIVWDFIRFAREKGIFVGPGRGSAAGSLVSYCLRITDIDPLKYDLLFERFLNPERISMPDIDIDFCFERRGEVIEYVVSKYGADRVAQIVTFGTLAARAAIRDAGRAMSVPLSLVDKVAKLIPTDLGMTIAKALEVSQELKRLRQDDDLVRELLATAEALEGMPRHVGTHAAGVVISQEPLDHYLPLQRTSEGLVSTQFDKDTVEEIGLLKMDLLGLRTLTVINKAVKLIEESQNKQIDLSHIPLDDPQTYELLARGDTIGVFQLESSGLRSILRDLKPQDFEDIIALVALYRPGPLGSGMVEDFIRRRHKEVEATYLDPHLEPILKPTYGVIIYQEQVMRIASELGGFTLGEADLLRRAMGKKKPEIIAGLRQQFIDGAVGKNIERDTAGKIFDLMEYFAGYGFNKSHSAAYALLAYQTAYLKALYPVEYMAALLTSVMESSDRVPFYIEECRQNKIEILPPDVNESRENFVVTRHKIRFGLAAIKQLGNAAIMAIIQEREKACFTSLQDFCERVDLSVVNRRVIENLIKCGAFSSMAGSKAQLLQILHLCMEQGLSWQRQKNSNQLSLFSMQDSYNPPIPLPQARDFEEKEILQMEKEVLGIYLSGHPLTQYQALLAKVVSCPIEEMSQAPEGQNITLGGLITAIKRTVTKRGQAMAYVTLEDLTGSVECLVFPQNMDKVKDILQTEQAVLVRGRLTLEDNPKVLVDSIKPLGEDSQEEYNASSRGHQAVREQSISVGVPAEKLYVRVPSNLDDDEMWSDLVDILQQYPGSTPLFVYYPEQKKLIQSDPKYWVAISTSLLRDLEELFGVGAVSVVSK